MTCRSSIAGRLAAGIGIAGQRTRRVGINRGRHQPAALQVGRRKRAGHAFLAGQRGQAAGFGARIIAGCEHHQAAVVDDKRTILGRHLRGGRQVGPLIRSWWTCATPSGPLKALPRPLPSSVGRVSEMIRADTICAPGAMPPGHVPTAAPAARLATAVPWPTTSSTARLFLAGSM
ncbi:hypothetical protein G6F23_013422 [Rhizopus arrhizus]|nr:hypothetical protein G6F23_013422 [Rhizopus arrhizus]